MKSLNSEKRLDEVLKEDSKIKEYFNELDLKELFLLGNKIKHIERIFKKAFEN